MRQLLSVATALVNEPPGNMTDVEARWLTLEMPIENPSRPGDLERVTEFLEAWTQLLDLPDEEQRVAQLNTMLVRFSGPPSVTDHDGSGWHLHYRPADASLGHTIAASISVATAEHLARNGVHRLGRCALPECRRAFADFSRPGSQRYCSHPCANRDAVRRHRRATGPARAAARPR